MTTTVHHNDYCFDPHHSLSSTVVDLNNRAVSYLQQGNYRSAVWDLERALEVLEDPKVWYYHDYHYYYGQTAASCENNMAGALRVHSVPIAPLEHNETARDNVFEFYRRAFHVSTSRSDQCRIPPSSILIVIKFNMAVAYHDDAIRRNRLSHFQKAQELYQDILSLMRQHHIKGHMLLLMAIGNNLGHIHSHLMNFPESRDALYWVRELALNCQEYGPAVPYSDYSDYSFFYKTAIIFHGYHDLTLAPAA